MKILENDTFEKYFPVILSVSVVLFSFFFLLHEGVTIRNVALCDAGFVLTILMFGRTVSMDIVSPARSVIEFGLAMFILVFGGLLVLFESIGVTPYLLSVLAVAAYYVLTLRGPRVPKNTTLLTDERAYVTGERYPLNFFTSTETPLMLVHGKQISIKTGDVLCGDGEKRRAESLVSWYPGFFRNKAHYELVNNEYIAALADATSKIETKTDASALAQSIERKFFIMFNIKQIKFTFESRKEREINF